MPHTAIQKTEESLAIDNIFGNPPGWLIYWGITSTTLFLVICLGISAFVRYPDKMTATAVINTPNAPLQVVSPSSGKIAKLFFKDKTAISETTILAIIQDEAHWEHVFGLEKALNNQTAGLFDRDNLKLGTISPLFEDLRRVYHQLLQNKQYDISEKRITALRNEIDKIVQLNTTLEKQKQLYLVELTNEKKDFDRSAQLLKEGVISQLDFEKSENNTLQNKRNFENINSSITSNEIRIEQLNTEILTIQKNQNEQVGSLKTDFEQKKQLVLNAIKIWKDRQIICSPINGVISLPYSVQEGVFIKADETLCTVVPSHETHESIVVAQVPARGVGNIHIGQKAIIDLDNYPANQYGVLEEKVSDISLIPNADTYAVILTLTNGWKTTYNKTILQQQSLKANVSIATKDYSLLERVFQNFLDITKNKASQN